MVEVCLSTGELVLIFQLKYVDDFLLAIRIDQIDLIMEVFCDYDDRIKFTCDRELDGKICFLDTWVIRHNGHLITNWYCKPMSSNRLVSFCSYQSYWTKINTAFRFIHRALKLSDECFHKTRLDDIRRILILNNYPDSVIDTLVKRYRRQNSDMPQIKVQNMDTKFAGLTYVNGLAENLAKLFKEEIPDLSVAFKYTRKAGDIYSVIKDKLDHSRKANVVYEIPCRDCDVAYIGQTGRQLGTRLKEHDNDQRKSMMGLNRAIRHNGGC